MTDLAPQPPPKYEICLIGSGGVGTIASLVLTKSNLARVTVVLRSKYAHVADHGWEIDSVDHGRISKWKPDRVVRSAEEAATRESERESKSEPDPQHNAAAKEDAEQNQPPRVEYDYVVLATKALPSLCPPVPTLSPVITPGKTTIVLIQNGIGIEESIIEAWPTNVVMSSVSHIGSEVRDPNLVVQIGKDVSKMGPHLHAGVDEAVSMERAREFVEMYVAGGAHSCVLTRTIAVDRWEKLLWNGTFNPICALLRMDVGEVQRSRARETLLVPMMWEIWRIAEAAGQGMPESVVEWMAYRLPDDCAYRPSMLLDLENGRAMETEVILGNALRVAGEVGVAAPVLETVWKLLRVEEWRVGEMKKDKVEKKT
ncbi:ketopantoate reductase PanE/ApbA C terminal-domain-containing protein [Aspergillus heterothallicus]